MGPKAHYSLPQYSMRVLPVSEENLREAIRVLRGGGVIAHATETCYGFACDLTNPEAVERLFRLKQRPFGQPVSALFASMEDARKYVVWNEKAEELAEKHWPGPLTIVLGQRTKDLGLRIFSCPLSPVPSPKSLGVRVSSHPVAQKLVEEFGSPLSTTSANLHGKPEPYSVREIAEQFSGKALWPDLLIDSGDLPHRAPSTIIEVQARKILLVRKGSITIE